MITLHFELVGRPADTSIAFYLSRTEIGRLSSVFSIIPSGYRLDTVTGYKYGDPDYEYQQALLIGDLSGSIPNSVR